MSEYQVKEGAHSARAGCARRAIARRRCPCSLGGCGPPGLPPCAYARAAARPPRGRRPGPGGGQRPPLPAFLLPRLRRYAKMYVGPCFPCPPPLWVGVLRSLFALFACCRAAALRLLPSPASARAPRPRFAAPVRRFLPRASRSPGPGRSLSPRLPRSGRVRRCAAPWPLAAAPALCFPSLRCGLPVRSPWLCSWSPLRFGSARRVPPWSPPRGFGAPPARCGSPPGASGPGPPRPGLRRLCRRASAPPRALFLLGCFAPCAVLLRVGFSPAPPRPAAPAGGSGVRGAHLGGPAGPHPALPGGSPGVGLLSFCRASSHCSGGSRVKPCGCAALDLRRPLGVAARQKGVSAYEAFGSSVNHRFPEGVPRSLSRR